MFLLCTFPTGVYSLRCQNEYCELERAPWSFFSSSLHHWTHWRAFCRWTHAVQTPHDNTTGYIWGGTLHRQEALLKAQTAKAAEVSFWHDETKLTTRYTWVFHYPCPAAISSYLPLYLCFHFSAIQRAVLFFCLLI